MQGERHVQKRVSFDRFRDLLCNYVATQLVEANNVTCLIRNLEDPIRKYKNNKPQMDKNSDGSDKKLADLSEIDQLILKESVKSYASGLKNIETNSQRIFGIIWGQCTSGLQAAIRAESDVGNNTLIRREIGKV